MTWSRVPTETPPEVTTTSASLERAGERLAGRAGVVAHALDRHHLGARLLAARGDQDAVRLVDLPVAQRLAGRHELVARDHDGDARDAVAAELGDASGRDRRERQRAQAASRRDDDGVRRDVGALAAHVIAGRTAPSNETRSPFAWARSTGTTASAPSGSGAPVAIVIAVPGSSRTGSSPANDPPATGSSPPASAARTA